VVWNVQYETADFRNWNKEQKRRALGSLWEGVPSFPFKRKLLMKRERWWENSHPLENIFSPWTKNSEKEWLKTKLFLALWLVRDLNSQALSLIRLKKRYISYKVIDIGLFLIHCERRSKTSWKFVQVAQGSFLKLQTMFYSYQI